MREQREVSLNRGKGVPACPLTQSVPRQALYPSRQKPDPDEQAGEGDLLLGIRRQRHHLAISRQQRGQAMPPSGFTIVQPKMPEIIVGCGSPDLAEVDNAGVAPVFLVDVGDVEVAVGEMRLPNIEPRRVLLDQTPDETHLVHRETGSGA